MKRKLHNCVESSTASTAHGLPDNDCDVPMTVLTVMAVIADLAHCTGLRKSWP